MRGNLSKPLVHHLLSSSHETLARHWVSRRSGSHGRANGLARFAAPSQRNLAESAWVEHPLVNPRIVMDDGLSSLEAKLSSLLARRESRSQLRRLTTVSPGMVDFSSNSYLSLSDHPDVQRAYLALLNSHINKPSSAASPPILGSGGSRLLDGNSSFSESLERDIASFHGAPAGLLFTSGFDANVGLFSCVPQPDDIIVYDELIHASVHDGMKLSRAAQRLPFRHNTVSTDPSHTKKGLKGLDALLQDLTTGDSGKELFKGNKNVFVAVEGVYSMDGDVAPLQEIVNCVNSRLPKGNGYIIVDEAHSTGIYGAQGRGLVCELGLEKHIFARVHTFGKAMGCSGVEETSQNGSGRKRRFSFVGEEIDKESKRQVVGGEIDVGLEMDMNLVDAYDLDRTTRYSQDSQSGYEAANGLRAPHGESCSSWDEQHEGRFRSPATQGMLLSMGDLDDTLEMPSTLEASKLDPEVFPEPYLDMEMVETATIALHDGELELVNPSLGALTPIEELQRSSGENKEEGNDSYSSNLPAGVTKMESSTEYDTCFGVVVVETTLDRTASVPDDLSLTVRVSGNVISLYKEINNFVGLFISEGLGSLVGRFSVQLTATLDPKTPKEGSCVKRGKVGKVQTQKRPIIGRLTRVVIYGLFADKDPIGKHLSEADLYLQHPKLEEYDQSVEYFNPHLLLRPGAKMPKIEDLDLHGKEEMSSGPTILDETSKGRIWRIFDFASGEEVIPEVISSSRLKTTLKVHQLAALEMMIERECGVIDGAKFPTLWEPLPSALGPSKRILSLSRYRNKVTGCLDKNPASLRGGILADEMGLGKTLSTLALICCYLDARDGTLFLLRKSTRLTALALIGWETQIKKHNQVLELVGYDIVLTTYEVLRQDFVTKHDRDTIYSHKWRRTVLDEGWQKSIDAGTPIHNSLDDYAALLSFLQVRGLHEKNGFDRLVATPIKHNHPKSMERLQALVRATSLRRTMGLNGASLGLQSRSEKVDFVELSVSDAKLYQFFQEKSSRIARADANILRKMCDESDEIDEEQKVIDECSACQQSLGLDPKPSGPSSRSAKVEALIRNIHGEQKPCADGVVKKSVVFSCWTKMIDHVQKDLEYEGFNLERIDGQASLDQRRRAIHRFKNDSNCTILLASIGSAGEGIDLISACHVHILEPQWNPMTESQAIGRVHRFGQKQRVTVTRYIVKKSIETYIQWIQVEKLRLISQSIDHDPTSQAELEETRWKRLQDTLALNI
ncbi:hypothetical protein G7Z17_g1537 [Cylindrodendrum hubeiense]|uniref:Helicase C-terminal domain-containing protein n=1 Tax=Cylindrodendrum hubeiense TaxID=595255 RepID=A0A9P5HLC4_9HYPO|nr:hypothetical protein G7Z17_g1537 [Cylindrodendrum hubeiense]